LKIIYEIGAKLSLRIQ